MNESPEAPRRTIRKALFGESTVLAVIGLNAVVLFLHAFPGNRLGLTGEVLEWIDYVCMTYFVLEAATKMGSLGVRGYFRSGWNRFDFLVVMAGAPLLLHPPFLAETISAHSAVPLLRMGRFLRFIRILRVIPNAEHIGRGVLRALRSSVGVFLVLLLLNFTLALGATVLFGDLPGADRYFGDPITSIYSLFKVFTVEGWYEIPDDLAENGASPAWVAVLRIYFILTVLIGGILGLSLANAVFVDEMTTDNNDELERMVTELRSEIRELRAEVQQALPRQDPNPP